MIQILTKLKKIKQVNQNAESNDELIEALVLSCKELEYRTEYYNKDGKLHRFYGPAIIYADGDNDWYKAGILYGKVRYYKNISGKIVNLRCYKGMYELVSREELAAILVLNGFKNIKKYL